MATASQKMMLMRFFVLILGALTPAPKIDEPVIQIPLQNATQHNTTQRSQNTDEVFKAKRSATQHNTTQSDYT